MALHPVTNQPPVPPPGGSWMQLPLVPKCPPGLECLTKIDQIICHQIVELLQVFTGFETNNKYVIKNGMGQQIYYVFEDTDCCSRFFCGSGRDFLLKVVDNYQREVMRITRPFVCFGGCCWCADCCGHVVTVESPPGTVIGRVRQISSSCTLDFCIESADGQPQLNVKGPFLTCRCCTDVEFPVQSLDGTQQVGMITKQWSGLARELFTNSDNFGISFPMDLDVKTKGTLIGAMFLIDFLAFEQDQSSH